MKPNNERLDVTFWVCQWILAIDFHFIALVKLGLTGDQVRQLFGLTAATTGMLHTVALVEVAVSLIVILPAVTRVVPQLSVVAAGGLAAIALLGTFVPESAAGTGVLALNFGLAALAGFVVWGRVAIAPLSPSPVDRLEKQSSLAVVELEIEDAARERAHDDGGIGLTDPDDVAVVLDLQRRRGSAEDRGAFWRDQRR